MTLYPQFFTTAAAGTQQSSLESLRPARENSYYKDDKGLWVKVVAANTGGAAGPGGAPGGPAGLQVSRYVQVSSAR